MTRWFRTVVVLLGGSAAVSLVACSSPPLNKQTPMAASSEGRAGQRDELVSAQQAASTLLQTSSPGDAGGLLPVQGTLGVSDLGCVTLTDRIERIVVVSADGRLSEDGTEVLIAGEGTFRIGDHIRHEGWTRRRLNNLPDELVPRAHDRCEPGPYVFLDPT